MVHAHHGPCLASNRCWQACAARRQYGRGSIGRPSLCSAPAAQAVRCTEGPFGTLWASGSSLRNQRGRPGRTQSYLAQHRRALSRPDHRQQAPHLRRAPQLRSRLTRSTQLPPRGQLPGGRGSSDLPLRSCETEALPHQGTAALPPSRLRGTHPLLTDGAVEFSTGHHTPHDCPGRFCQWRIGGGSVMFGCGWPALPR